MCVWQAVCCSDKEHCCPHGYTCDAASASCTPALEDTSASSADVIKAARKTEARAIAQSSENGVNVLCPDHKSACAAGQTCCPIGGGQWGCCPFDEAVCCDPTYCCEKGYTCRDKKCYKGDQWKDATLKLPSRPVDVSQDVNVSSVLCPDQRTRCPDGDTCCPLTSGYGCCPLAQVLVSLSAHSNALEFLSTSWCY